MKTLIASGIAVLFWTGVLYAGQVLGTLTEGGKSIGQGIEVIVECPDSQPISVKTDGFGAYRINVEKIGSCKLTVNYKGQKPSTTINSSAQTVAADFDLQLQDGKYKLVRR